MHGNEVWWAAAGGAAVTLITALVKVWFMFQSKRLEHDVERNRAEAEDRKTARREATAEAWEVVDRLNQEVAAHTNRIIELEAKHERLLNEANERERQAQARVAKCEAEHARTEGRLHIIEAWARQRGLRIPPKDGSGAHVPLPSDLND